MRFAIPPAGAVAVLFLSVRNAMDASGYSAAAAQMEAAAASMPGFIGFTAARGSDGVGIAVSYWADEAAAHACAIRGGPSGMIIIASASPR